MAGPSCICCGALPNGGRLLLLSCSHVLHRHCLRSYEHFTSGEAVMGGARMDGSAVERGEASKRVEAADTAGVDVLFVPAGCVCPYCRAHYAKIALQT